MMTAAQVEYELDYWRQEDCASYELRQREMLRLWGFRGAAVVLEVGCGPWGGCLPYVDAQVKHACDATPYPKLLAGLERPKGISEWYWMPVERFARGPGRLYDAVLCCNTLDHGDSNFSAVDSIASLLHPGGRFYLHVNLRTPDQLNEGHDHCLHLEDLRSAVARNEFQEIKMDVYEFDPLAKQTPYRTVVGVWEKPA